MEETFANYLTKVGACVVAGDDDYKIVGFKTNPYILFEDWKEQKPCHLQHIVPKQVPAEVAQWYEENADDLEFNLWRYIYSFDEHQGEFMHNFIDRNPLALDTIINMKHGYISERTRLFKLVNPVTQRYLHKDRNTGMLFELSKLNDDKNNQGIFNGVEIQELGASFYKKVEIKE